MLDAESLKRLWDSTDAERALMMTRRTYYEGRERIAELMMPRIDGRVKSAIRTNWVRYAATQHAGFLLGNKPSYVSREDDAERGDRAIAGLIRAYERDRWHRLDYRLFLDALLYGRAVEVRTFDGADVRLHYRPAYEWAIVLDQDDQLLVAVHRAALKKGSWFRGGILEEDLSLLTEYDDSTITTWTVNKKGVPTDPIVTPHPYGQIPVGLFSVTDDLKPYFQQAFLDASDAYNVTRGALADDIKFNVDSLLKIKGLRPEDLLKEDEDGVTVAEKQRQAGLWFLPEGGDADYINRDVNVEKFREDLRVSRASLHLMACLPDLDETIGGNDGTITNISGIALRLLFHAMELQSDHFARNFELGLRDRVEFVNGIWRRQGDGAPPSLERFEITFNRKLPRNDIEWVQYLPNMQGTLAKEDQLRQLPFIDDVPGALRRLQEEAAASLGIEPPEAAPVRRPMGFVPPEA